MAFDFKAATPGSAAASSVLFGAASTGAASPSLFTSTGSGSVVLATSPTLTTPNLGTPSALTLTNATGLPVGGLASIGANTFVANGTGGSASPTALSASSATALLSAFTGDSGSGGVKGLVPAPASGDAAAGKYLKADGTWAAVSGGGGTPGGSSGQIQFNNAGSFGGLDLSYSSATLRLGAADAAAPVAQTLQVQSVVAGTSNTAGVNWTLRGSAGTGNAAGGSILFQVAPAGTSGTAQNGYATALTIDSTKKVTATGGLDVTGGSIKWGPFGSTIFELNNSGGELNLYVNGQNYYFGGTANPRVQIGSDVALYRDAANTLGQRNGANAQEFRVYNTWTSATNFEAYDIDWKTTSNIALVGPTKGSGGGTQRVQRLQYLEDGGAGSTTPSLGTTCPAASATIKSWIKVVTSDGTTGYIPCWA